MSETGRKKAATATTLHLTPESMLFHLAMSWTLIRIGKIFRFGQPIAHPNIQGCPSYHVKIAKQVTAFNGLDGNSPTREPTLQLSHNLKLLTLYKLLNLLSLLNLLKQVTAFNGLDGNSPAREPTL